MIIFRLHSMEYFSNYEKGLGMVTFKNTMVRYHIGTNETVQHFNGIANSISLHCYLKIMSWIVMFRIQDNP